MPPSLLFPGKLLFQQPTKPLGIKIWFFRSPWSPVALLYVILTKAQHSCESCNILLWLKAQHSCEPWSCKVLGHQNQLGHFPSSVQALDGTLGLIRHGHLCFVANQWHLISAAPLALHTSFPGSSWRVFSLFLSLSPTKAWRKEHGVQNATWSSVVHFLPPVYKSSVLLEVPIDWSTQIFFWNVSLCWWSNMECEYLKTLSLLISFGPEKTNLSHNLVSSRYGFLDWDCRKLPFKMKILVSKCSTFLNLIAMK